MLTRLRVSGFKNLHDVDVRFGPFTCIAGANGVGKSNLFDALLFLATLADRTLIEAARSVRSEGTPATDPRSLFTRAAEQRAPRMTFLAEMIVPWEGTDELGATATASATLLEYELSLAYREGGSPFALGELEVVHERLRPLPREEGSPRFHTTAPWLTSAIKGSRRNPYISTDVEASNQVIKLFQEGRQGRPLSRIADGLKRTVLSNATTAEYPTAFLARREMRSWRLLQLEPSALREPDAFTAPVQMAANGAHLPASVFALADAAESGRSAVAPDSAAVYARIANRLAGLIEDVRTVSVDRDDQRQLLTLQVADRDGTVHSARSLSDGTLRFLALAVLEQQPWATGVLCLEEPENGIHPGRIPAMLRLLRDIAVDPAFPVDEDNPLRQVIVNTHSPAVVQQVPADSLLLAEPVTIRIGSASTRAVTFRGLSNTWRTAADGTSPPLTLGRLLAYLNPVIDAPPGDAEADEGAEEPDRSVRAHPTVHRLIAPVGSDAA